jgi:hypothetical protein
MGFQVADKFRRTLNAVLFLSIVSSHEHLRTLSQYDSSTPSDFQLLLSPTLEGNNSIESGFTKLADFDERLKHDSDKQTSKEDATQSEACAV